jgi:trans-2,3-dihydro-3-hydroxyanthranilate isomerase
MHRFYFVDVFAEKKYAGNPLAVFRDAADLSDAEMQAIAREINFSETTFILSDYLRDGGYDVRIFTPKAELPFAGHPTLGTAFIIRERIIKQPVQQITLNLGVGKIPVSFENDGYLWMQQINPSFGRRLSANEIAPLLNLKEEDFDQRFPIEEVSTGLPFFIVPLKSLQTVGILRVNLERYYDWLYRAHPVLKTKPQTLVASGFMIFCPETAEPGNHLHARMFDDYFGVPEDPATGSCCGCLLGYLLKHNYFKKSELDLRVEQGYELGRPSLLRIRGKKISGRQFEIFVGGKVQMAAQGEWNS